MVVHDAGCLAVGNPGIINVVIIIGYGDLRVIGSITDEVDEALAAAHAGVFHQVPIARATLQRLALGLVGPHGAIRFLQA
jgi:hypothetical protein